jgi:hypothetical protein
LVAARIHPFIQYRWLTVTHRGSQSRIWMNCYHCTYPYAYKTNECFGISNDKIHHWSFSPMDDDPLDPNSDGLSLCVWWDLRCACRLAWTAVQEMKERPRRKSHSQKLTNLRLHASS